MANKNYKVGDRVRFRGTAGNNGRFTSVWTGGPDSFEAVVSVLLDAGECYGLEWDDGSPVGLPFHDFQLEKG